MKTVCISFLFLLISIRQGNSQNINIFDYQAIKAQSCETLAPQSGYYRDSFFIDYIIRTKLKEGSLGSIVINDRNQLNKFVPVICNDQTVEIKGKSANNDEVSIKIKKQKLALKVGENVELMLLPGYVDTFISTVNGHDAYGIDRLKDSVELIERIDILIGDSLLSLPDYAFHDLFFPNFCETYYSIKPIEVFSYKSGSSEFFYVYIFGKNDLASNEHGLRGVQSFMAKLIFNRKEYLGRILAHWGELNAYNWECPNFIGF